MNSWRFRFVLVRLGVLLWAGSGARAAETAPVPVPAPVPIPDAERPAARRELATRILSDRDLDEVLTRARALVAQGLNAGDGYGEVWIRDLNTFIELALQDGDPARIREALLTFFKFQGEGGDIVDGYIPEAKASVGYQYRRSALAPGWLAHKNTVETDQESSLVQAVARYVRMTGDRAFLAERVDGKAVRERLGAALRYLFRERFDAGHGLIWGATTADWGDVQPEHEWGVEFDASSHRALDIYDNALLIVAIQHLTGLGADAVTADERGEWDERVRSLREAIRRHLWDPARVKFKPHVYLAGSPFPADFDEAAVWYHGGTAVAIEAEILDTAGVRAALEAMRENVRKAGAASIGLTVYPPYPDGLFKNKGMQAWSYQNGGDWCWFGGRMIQQLVRHDLPAEAYTELKPMVTRVLRHQGFFEWWTRDNQPRGSGRFRGSAGVLGRAIQMLQAWARAELAAPPTGIHGAAADVPAAFGPGPGPGGRRGPDYEVPNLLLIYADDLGYGDLGCYGAERVATPNIDRLAREGLRFTDAHSPAATCTPSRYALLTGEYAWRRKGTGVLPGDAALILDPARPTMASVLRKAGYRTGVVGKWHLGLGPGPGKTDWNGEIRPGPLEVGFDQAFIMPATGDRVPCVYVEDRRVAGLDPADPLRVSFAGPLGEEPTGKANPEQLTLAPSHGHDMTIIGGVSRIGYMSGGRAARWKDADMADDFARRGVAFLERARREPGGRPFFLFFATHDIHVPRVPHRRFVGSTPMGARGDAIAQFDATVGELLRSLDRLGLATNTLVILTSDNGPVVDDGYRDEAVEKLGGHRPAGPWRGGKYSAFEGGTRVPFLVRWPAKVKPGVSDALFGQIDLFASFAALAGQTLPPGTAPDSRSALPTLLGVSKDSRDHLVQQAGALALRRGPWKYIEPGRGPRFSAPTATETGQDPDGQLYRLDLDPGERTNRIRTDAEQATAMREELEALRREGGRRP